MKKGSKAAQVEKWHQNLKEEENPKGQVRKTARRAYTKVKKRVKRRVKKSKDAWSF